MKYCGTELELFALACNWKNYFARHMAPFVKGRVLEVGAGMGANAPYLMGQEVVSYTFLEPDGNLLAKIPTTTAHPLLNSARRLKGTITNMVGERFDAILYVDVIEHIEDSTAELHHAFDRLEPNGHLIILVPAFPFLYSAFDRECGHYRRYTKQQLLSELPAKAEIIRMRYLDSIGMVLPLANRMLLRQGRPTKDQVLFWDRYVIPISRVLDTFIDYGFGRSLLAVMRKPLHPQ